MPELEDKLKSAGLPENPNEIINRVFRADYSNGIICGTIKWLSVEASLTLKLFVSSREALSGFEMKKISHFCFTRCAWEIVFLDNSNIKIDSLVIY